MIAAIQTRYGNHHFRSRLEARWAVFFDHIGQRWDYEPEGFELPSGRYLPDFYLHREEGEYSQFIEIKPAVLSVREKIDATRKLFELCEMTHKEAILIMGSPQDNFDDPGDRVDLVKISRTGFVYRPVLFGARCYLRPLPSEAKPCAFPTGTNVSGIGYPEHRKDVSAAVRAAMSARFEFEAR
jgi:hypothetical protein